MAAGAQRGAGLALAALWAAATVSIAGGSAGDGESFLGENPGHSLGIPACLGSNPKVACWRADLPTPTERCVERDPETQVCLRIERISSVERAVPEWSTQRADVAQSATGDPVACDGTDLTCVPDGVHLTSDIDWSTVEGAEFLVLPSSPPSSSLSIYVDPVAGSDHHNTGTRKSPYKSLRRALARWLYPGKCHPYCASVSLGSSANVYLAPGTYSGDGNRMLELLLSAGVSLSVHADLFAGGGGVFGGYVRDAGVAVTTENRLDTFVVKASGGGALSLSGFAVRNSSSIAIVTDASISLQTDLQYDHGRYMEWRQVVTGGVVTREPAWDTASDFRVRGKTVSCEGAAGCRVVDDVFMFDGRYQGELTVSEAACLTCGVPSPVGYKGDNGLGVYISDGGGGCLNAGTLVALGKGPGSGFSATFTVTDGAISSVTIVDAGSGFREGSEVSIVIESGGVACADYVLTPYLAVAPVYPPEV